MKGIFGHIPGYKEGYEFTSRIELSLSGVHAPRQAGISGSQSEGANSIVVSGGYEDDEDFGDVIIYTGHGGRDQITGKQITDQELVRGNLALALSCQKGLPVRIIRGMHRESIYAPKEGYRYDGLFRVEKYWKDKGRGGYTIWRFQLRKINPSLNDSFVIQEYQSDYKKSKRLKTTIQRIIRDTELSRYIKELYKYRCQVCDTAISTTSGLYAEAAHIKPLGVPHNGPDIIENILCLCPNHHVMFDYGGFSILDDFSLIGIGGFLQINPKHMINKSFIKYHLEHFYDEKYK